MADLAFEPNAPTDYRTFSDPALWGDGQQVAQAPAPAPMPEPRVPAPLAPPAQMPQPPVVTPQTPPAPMPQPPGYASPGTALRTDVDPLWSAPATQAPIAPWTDADDLNERREAQREAQRFYNDPNRVLSTSDQYIPMHGATKPEQHPLYDRHQELLKLWPTLTPQQRAAYGPSRKAMETKMNADLKADNLDRRKRQEDELKKADAKWEDPAEREKNAAIVAGHIDQVAKDTEAWSKHKNPKIKNQNDYDFKVGPLTTMRRARPDGTYDYQPLRDATNTIIMLNGGLSNEQATRHALRLGSPVGFDDDGRPSYGYNGRRGAGAANYKVIGRDVRHNVIVEMNDGTKLRMPPQVLEQFVTAREKGYVAARQWEKDYKEANKEGLVGRTFNWARDKIK